MSYTARRNQQRLKAVAVEAALIGMSRVFADWPELYEHRCYFDRQRLTCCCGWRYSYTNMNGQIAMMLLTVERWANDNRYANDPHWSPLQEMYKQSYNLTP